MLSWEAATQVSLSRLRSGVRCAAPPTAPIHVATEAIEKDDTRTAGGEPMVGDCCSIMTW
jgi:hypothetical protein